MQSPAPGGKVRSAQAETETISGISTFIVLSPFKVLPDLPKRVGDVCVCSPPMLS